MRTLLFAAFLSIPVFSAWIWYSRLSEAPPARSAQAPVIQRLPVEVIAKEDQPKWLLVPINPD